MGNPNIPLTLTVNATATQSGGGGRFGGGGGQNGGGDTAEGRIVTMLGTVQGNAKKTTVANDGTFTLTFSSALTANTPYAVAVFVDRNHDNTCDDQDDRWIVQVPASTMDVTVTIDGNTQQDAGACAAF